MKNIILLAVVIIAFSIGAWYANEYGFTFPLFNGWDKQGVATNGPSEPPPPVRIYYLNTSSDDIQITTPTPGGGVPRNFTVTGKARGSWYFEASFPLEIRDVDNNVLLQVPVEAQGDWMTSELVPYSIDVRVPGDYTGPASLVLFNANAADLPVHGKSITLPIFIN